MTESSPFPRVPQASLSRDDVVAFLLQCMADGHTVYQGGGENAFILSFDDARIIIVLERPGRRWEVQYERLGMPVTAARPQTFAELEQGVAQAALLLAKPWPHRPTTGRLAEATPATNYRTISQLVGSAQVEAVFDPFLENSSLTTLIDILSFGNGGVSNSLRLLGSTKKTGGAIPKFTKVGVDAWLAQLGVTGEARVMPPTEHRRFMLLSGGRSLILGHSLNAIHKNEAVRLEPDADDRAFFDGVWKTAVPLT
jgi:hypothetical protein